MIVLVFLLTTVITFGTYYVIQRLLARRRFHEVVKNIPSPKGYFFIGNGLDNRRAENFLPNMLRYQTELGLTFRLEIGPDTFVFTADPNTIEAIASSNTQIGKSKTHKMLKEWVGYGLLTASNPRWKNQRRLVTPSFHFNILQRFMPAVQKNTNNLLNHWIELVGDGPKEIDIYGGVRICALDTMCETAMGVPLNALTYGEESNFLKSISFIGRLFVERLFSFWRQYDFLYRLSSTYKVDLEMQKVFHNLTRDVIRRKKETFIAEKKNTQNSETDFNVKRKDAFLDYLMNAVEEKTLTEENLFEEVNTLFFAGHDTTAAGTAFAIYNLANNPEVQQKVYEEIMEVLDGDETISVQKLPNLKYTEMVIKETLRMYPPVPFVTRLIDEDVVYNGYNLPKGIYLVVSVYGTHRNPAIYPEPDKFDPERFSTENISKRHPFAFVPFSAGPRNCIGSRFALMEMKVFLATWIKHFKFSKSPEVDVKPCGEGVLRSVNGVHLVLERRK